MLKLRIETAAAHRYIYFSTPANPCRSNALAARESPPASPSSQWCSE